MTIFEAYEIFAASPCPPSACPVEIELAGNVRCTERGAWLLYRVAIVKLSGMLPAVSDVESLREALEHGESLVIGGVLEQQAIIAEIENIFGKVVYGVHAVDEEDAAYLWN